MAVFWLRRAGSLAAERASLRKKLTVVVEEHDTVAEQAPALFRMSSYRAGGLTVESRRGWASENVVACPGTGSECSGSSPVPID
jgi:hypothetical protein